MPDDQLADERGIADHFTEEKTRSAVSSGQQARGIPLSPLSQLIIVIMGRRPSSRVWPYLPLHSRLFGTLSENLSGTRDELM